ncbi:MAG: hypothetical protein KAX54_00290 [Thauera sp.]|nr:hypothetical protein [Thauera sp.]
MQVQVVNAMVGVRQSPSDEMYKLQLFKSGPDALRVTELPVLQAVNGLESITEVSVVGTIEVNKAEEHERLIAKYGADAVKLVYPSPAAPMPKTVHDVELEPGAVLSAEDPDAIPGTKTKAA